MLSEEELKEFTNFNAAAYDLLRKEAGHRGEKVPLWLCLNTQAKEQCRQEFYEWGKINFTIRTHSLEHLEWTLNQLSPCSLIENWILMETVAKEERESGGVGGYFV